LCVTTVNGFKPTGFNPTLLQRVDFPRSGATPGARHRVGSVVDDHISDRLLLLIHHVGERGECGISDRWPGAWIKFDHVEILPRGIPGAVLGKLALKTLNLGFVALRL